MVVKSERGRISTCSDGRAVVRCSPDDREAVTRRMSEGFDGCRSVRTSGTLRGLRDRYPSLKVPQKRRR